MRLNENVKLIGKNVILIPYEEIHVEKYHKWMQSEELQQLTASMPLTLAQEYDMQKSWREDDDKCTFLILSRSTYERTGDEIASLIGDTNLFLQFGEEKCAEAEIMIAEDLARGKRYGWEAMLLMLKYGQAKLKIEKYIAKIGMQNEKSLRMFNKIQFQEISRSDVFEEITLECSVTKDWKNWLDTQVIFKSEKYNNKL